MGCKVEFRIPISPTRSFFHQVRFFDHALRELGGDYAGCKIVVVVGDRVARDEVLEQNTWAADRNIEWVCVPNSVFDRYGIHGTADYRYFPETDADVVILSDADTVLARDIDPLLSLMSGDDRIVAGHMAHSPPPNLESGAFSNLHPDMIWPRLLAEFGLDAPTRFHSYSMDHAQQYANVPAYFNLGFVALTRAALALVRDEIFQTQDKLLEVYPSFMRCQVALALISQNLGLRTYLLPAQYNLANDVRHLNANWLSADDARVIHYLRGDELKREEIVLPEFIKEAIARSGLNPVNRRLQQLLRSYAADAFGILSQ